MKAWEMVYLIDTGWSLLQREEELPKATRTALGTIRWQALTTRKMAAKQIMRQKELSESYIQFTAKMLDIKISYQRRLL